MRQVESKALYILTFLIAFLSVVIAGIGVFYTAGSEAYEVTNLYGQQIKLYGSGIYAHDSYFKAPVFRGSDLTMLFVAIPALILAALWDRKKKSLQARLFLTSVLSIFTYYSASIAFGVVYNSLHLAYIALFSASFFGLIIAMMSINLPQLETCFKQPLPHRGFAVFLVLSGIALIVAWLPDILSALIAGQPLAMIEVYTTEITYVIDMGLIAPAAFISLYLLKIRKGMGIIVLSILLTICAAIGVMVPIQTVFQSLAGIENSVPVLITKAGTFCVLAFFAVYYNVKLMRAVKD